MFIEDNKELINKAHFLEDFLDSFVSDTYHLNNIIFTHITDYLALVTSLEEHILLSNKDEVNNINYTLFTKSTKEENVNIVNKFYRNLNINFDINKEVPKENISYHTHDITKFSKDKDIELEKLIFGSCIPKANNGSPKILIPNNGLLSDSVTLVHELSHYRNYPWSKVGDNLTEVLSFAEETIYLDYLLRLGYKYEFYKINTINYDSFYDNIKKLIPTYRILTLYLKYENLSPKIYQNNFPNESYKKDIEAIYNNIFNIFQTFTNSTYHMLGYLLGVHLYIEYKQNKDYLNLIEQMHTNINKYSYEECLNILNLYPLKDKITILTDDINKINTSIKKRQYKKPLL